MTLAALMVSDVADVILNTSEFAETVTFTDGSLPDVEATVTVHLNQPIRDQTDGFAATIYTGSLQVTEATRTAILNSGTPYLKVTAKNHSWDLVDVGDVVAGMATVGIRREIPEHSNAIDLEGNQHRYG